MSTKIYLVEDKESIEPFPICSLCHEEIIDGNYTRHENQIVGHCCINSSIPCSYCDIRILQENNAGTEEEPICEHCFENNYFTCSECAAITNNAYGHTHPDADGLICRSCWELASEEEKLLHQYSYKPTPVFYKGKTKDPIYLGIELEIDSKNDQDLDYIASKLLSIANKKHKLMYIKKDSSLSVHGLELVFHPATLDYIVRYFPLKEIFKTAISLNYVSHQMLCGFHVHVGRKELGTDSEKIEDAISNIVFFVNKHWEEIVGFSRRLKTEIVKWCRKYPVKDTPKELLFEAKSSSNGRYSSINLLNNSTIEWRVFRGSLRYKTIIATLQFVDEICRLAKSISEEEMQDLSWQSWVEKIKYPELIEYLKQRKLYINEPVLENEEI